MAKQISEAALDAKSKIQMTTGDKVLNGIFYAFIALFAVICLVPFILVVSASFTQEQALTTYGYALWPREFSLDAYRLVVAGSDIPQAYLITIFTTVFGTFLSMLVTCMVAYALSLQSFRSRSALALFIYFTMLFNGGLVASYLLITKTLHLGPDTSVHLQRMEHYPDEELFQRNSGLPFRVRQAGWGKRYCHPLSDYPADFPSRNCNRWTVLCPQLLE